MQTTFNLDKIFSKIFLLIAVVIGFCFGSCSEYNRHSEQIKMLNLMDKNPLASMPLEQRLRAKRGQAK